MPSERAAAIVPGTLLDAMQEQGHEQVAFFHHPQSGLRAIVAIHSTVLGPALGGTRFHPFPDEATALADVLRLARAMTFKAAAAGLDLGGGKAVIIGDPRRDKSEELLRAYGRFVEGLGGRYVTAEDVGTTQADMEVIARETRFVTGRAPEHGGSGDPSPATAIGVFEAMRAAADHRWGAPDLGGRHVVVSGIGKVGSALVGHLLAAGCRVTVADTDPNATARLGAAAGAVEVVPADTAHTLECDVFSPCALGGALSPATIPALRCELVVGSANNQLAGPECAQLLQVAGVLYVPDYVANAGGIVNIAHEIDGPYCWERAEAAVRRIHDTTAALLRTAKEEGVTTTEAADRLALARIEDVGRLRLIRTGAVATDGHGTTWGEHG